MVLDSESLIGAMYNQRDNVLQMLKVDDEHPKPVIFSYPTKIECLSFYYEDYLIVGSKDQAIKVLKYTDLKQSDKKYRKGKLVNEGSKKNSMIEED